MQPIAPTKQSVRAIGEYISREYYQNLVDGFAAKHPAEERSVYIAKEFITMALADSPQVCGIRFMYGQKEGADVCMRTVLLMSCHEKAAGNLIPSLFFPASGHLTHEGERISTDACFAMFDRYVERMLTLLPDEHRKDIPRGCYFGREFLLHLLGQPECTGIRFHFGYDPTAGRLAERYAVVLEAVDDQGYSLGLFGDHGSLCPPNCPPIVPEGPGGWTLQAKPVRSIGSPVSREYYEYLIDGYARMHPAEEKSVYIAREIVTASLSDSPGACGIRFMYGLRSADDPRSRVVLLMACYEKLSDNLVPNLSFPALGYLTHAGERVSTEECFTLFDRHVGRMAGLLPAADRNQLPRGCFYGIETLQALLDHEGCAGIRFHFGYNATRSLLPLRYEVVLEAVNGLGRSLDLFFEEGQHCPYVCPPGWPGSGLQLQTAVNMHLLIGGDNGGALYEMYHNVSPALIDAMKQQGLDHESIYAEAFAEGFSLLAEEKRDEARAACKRSLGKLMRQYLIHN